MKRHFESLALLLISCLLSAVLHAQTVTVTPTSLSFGNQVVSTTSTAKVVTLKNGQSVVLTISSIGVSGDYAQSNNCGTSLAVNANCTINVTFTPTTTGARSGTLTVTDDASNSPQTVPLTGSGVLAATIAPTAFSFGNQVVGTTSAAKTATLKNNQKVAMSISSIATSGDYAQTNNCGTSLAALTSCTINITFTPTTTGTRTGTLTVTDSAANSPQTASLTGVGLAPATLAPATLGFGSEALNTTSAAKTATLTNNQSIALTISSIATTGDFAQANTCGTSIAAGSSCAINVTFTPTATGARTGTLTVTDSASNSPQTASLTGTGTTPPHIASLSATTGTVGTPVTITGTNFGSTQGANSTVTFNGTPGSPTSWIGTKIVVPVPAGATTGNVVVTVNGGKSNGVLFTVQGGSNGPVNYLYDDLNRLVGVVDATGNAAQYSYDAVGNVLSIARITPAQVSILNFSPEIGPVGTPVTINGTGFSTTVSQNTVKFNGTTAAVSSATTTQIQTTVPASATTGPISVTSPNGTTTSTTNFTVTPDSGIPTIISFAPASGVAGTAVTLTGTDFDPSIANDKLRLNTSTAVVSSAVPTTLGSTVPTATASGRFSLYTPTGNAVSTQDFYVPFLNHVATDIGSTARIVLGGSQAVTLAGGSIGLVLFDSATAQHVTVGISSSTFPSGCNLYLIAPNNSILNSTSCASGSSDLGSTSLSQGGTYTIGIDPGPSNSGSLTVSLSADTGGTIAIDGPPVTVTTTPGQDARLTFTSPVTPAPGKAIVIYATNVTNQQATLSLVQGGTIQNSVSINNNPAGQTFNLSNVLAGGTYQLWVQHSGANAGSVTLQILSSPSDFTGTLTVPAAGTAGPRTQVPTSGSLATGQNASLSFTGTVGQKLSFNIANSTIGTNSASCRATIYDPNRIPLGTGTCGLGSIFIDTVTLPSTGTYTLFINPLVPPVGSLAVSVNNDQDVTTPAITIGGSAVTATTTVSGQDVRLSFTASAPQQIGVLATNVTTRATLNLVSTTGTVIASTPLNSGQAGFLDTHQLSTAGTYQLWVQHNSTYNGSETLQIVTVPSDFTGTLAVPAPGTTGAATQVPTTGALAAGQNASLTFAGTAGQKLSFNVLNSTIGTSSVSCTVTVYDPSQVVVGTGYCGAGATFVNTISLASTGTYTFFINPQGSATGSVGISVNNDQDVTTPAITIGGSAVTATTVVPGQDVRLSVTATAAQHIGIYATNVTNPSATLSILSPSSATLTSSSINNNPAGQTFFVDTQVTAGTYQVLVQHSLASIGSETLQIVVVPADFTGTLTIPAAGSTGPATQVPTTGSLATGQNASLSFAGTAGQKLSFNVSNSTIGTFSSACRVTLYDPTQTGVGFGSCGLGSNYIDTLTLASTGTYTLYLDPQGSATGSASVSVNNDQDVTTPAISIGGSAVTATTTVAGQDVRLSFTASASQHIGVYATNVTNTSATLYVVSPSGSTLASTSIFAGQTFFLDAQLAAAGTYQLWVRHFSTYIGSETLQITGVPADFTGTLTVPAPGTAGPATLVPSTGNLAAGQNASLTFTGTTGQRLSFNLTGSTIGTTSSSCLVGITDPSARTVGSGNCGLGSSFIDSLTLASTGTYTFSINPQSSATGSVSVSINNDQDVTAPAISIGGSAVTETTTVAGQDVRLSFTVSSAQHIGVYATSVTNPSATLSVLSPSGATLISAVINNNPAGQTFFLDTQLTATGTYQLLVQHASTNIGNETLQIISIPADFTGTLTVPAVGATGSATQVPTTGNLAAGQNASLTFAGTVGQKLSFNVSGSTVGTASSSCMVKILDPSQATVGTGNCGTGATFVNAVTLASTGTFTFYIDPQGAAVGSLAVSVNNVSDFAGTLTVPSSGTGPATQVPSTGNLLPGQNASLTFAGTVGQKLSFNVVNSTIGTSASSCSVTIYDPTHVSIGTGNCGTGATFVNPVTLATTGTFTFYMTPQGGATGSASIAINNDSDFTGTLTIPAAGTTGPATQVPTTGNLLPGQNASLTFAGTSGQTLSFNILNSTIGTSYSNCNATLFDPSNHSIGTGSCGALTGNDLFSPVALASTGTYKLSLAPTSGATGNVSVSINNDQTVTAAVSIGGSPVTVTTTVAGQSASLTFSATANQIITVLMSNGTYPGCSVSQAGVNITIYNPDATKLTSYFCQGSGYLPRITLPQTGTYTINLQPGNWTYTGSMTFTLYNVADVNTTITPGGSPVTVTTDTVGQYANLTFSGSSGQRVALNLTNGTYPGCGITHSGITVRIYNPDATVLTQAGCLGTPFFFDTVNLVQTGTYTVRVDPTPYTGSVTLTLYSVPADVTGSIAIGGASFAFSTVVGQNANITFSNPQSQTVTLHWSADTYTSCNLTVTNSSNTQVGSSACQSATGSLGMTNLPAGTYNILVNPGGTTTGGLTINATSP